MKKAKKATSYDPGRAPLRATISQTKNNLSAYIERVRHGESILILDRDKPVARLVPVNGLAGDYQDEALIALERAGLVRRGPVDPRPHALQWQPVEPAAEVDILAALLEERREE